MPEAAHLTATAVEPSFEELAQAVDAAAAEVATLDDGPRKAAEQQRAAIEAAHKAGLVTIVRRLRADDAGRALLFELVDDPLIRMLFSLHGIIRTDTPSGVGAAGEHTVHEGTGGGCGCGSGHGVPGQAGPAIIPLSAIRRRDALDIWPGGAE